MSIYILTIYVFFKFNNFVLTITIINLIVFIVNYDYTFEIFVVYFFS